ncbi:hypothetical protein EV122DRAFT_249051 [Schizophyllum commune]
MFSRYCVLFIAFVLLFVAVVDAAPVKGLKQFKLKRCRKSPARNEGQSTMRYKSWVRDAAPNTWTPLGPLSGPIRGNGNFRQRGRDTGTQGQPTVAVARDRRRRRAVVVEAYCEVPATIRTLGRARLIAVRFERVIPSKDGVSNIVFAGELGYVVDDCHTYTEIDEGHEPDEEGLVRDLRSMLIKCRAGDQQGQ